MPSPEEQIAQLRAAMTALEGQRPLLGDAVVETALGSLREQLAALEAAAPAEQQRKQLTVLFADVSGFTALSETCLLYTSPSPRDRTRSRMPSSA